MELPGICKGGDCKNTFGSYACTCRPGYKLDESRQTCVGGLSFIYFFVIKLLNIVCVFIRQGPEVVTELLG